MDILPLDNVFWMAIALIFFVTLFGALARRLKRDRCLLLFHSHHVTLFCEGKQPVHGDLHVTSKGVELVFNPLLGKNTGRWRRSMMIYDQELSGCAMFSRIEHGLTDAEKRDRRQQTTRLVNPPLLQRTGRQFTNFVNIVRDAIIQSVGLFLGRMGNRPGGIGTLAREQSSKLTEFGGNVLGLFNNAYEPLLERHLGQLVILTVRTREKPEPVEVEFYGYLADYNERFIALLNPNQQLTEVFAGEIAAPHEFVGGRVERNGGGQTTFLCLGADALLLEEVHVSGKTLVTGVVLLKGQQFVVASEVGDAVRARVQRASAVDLLCPRTCAQVRYSGQQSKE
ncbi:MAG: hypothetical protein JNN07_18410 [Verrucomicrobiales bacterium]|nr:hypothetical protein [Verrucomicrobiales bacterium]